jgi:hypothetical protein
MAQLGHTSRHQAFFQSTRLKCECGSTDIICNKLIKSICGPCHSKLELVKLSSLKKEYRLNDDDLECVPQCDLPNPLFKHIPMPMTYKHLFLEKLPFIQQNKPGNRAKRKIVQLPLEEAKKELRYQKKCLAGKDYLSRVGR